MVGLNLIEKYPFTTNIVKNWYTEKLIESLNNDKVPEEFKQQMREMGVELDMLAVMIDVNPHALFEIFDNKELFITIIPKIAGSTTKFTYCVNDICLDNTQFSNRKDCEKAAIEYSFEFLENILKNSTLSVGEGLQDSE